MARLFSATLGGVVLVYLVIDFADRAHGFTGRAWGRAAAELYLNKAAVVAYQLAPAALIIAAALLITILSRRGEMTALPSLGVRPLRLAGPVALFAAAARSNCPGGCCASRCAAANRPASAPSSTRSRWPNAPRSPSR